jgi:hypothetical protein
VKWYHRCAERCLRIPRGAHGERRAARQERSKPFVLALKAWFEQQLARVSAKSLIADAIRYAFHHWNGLRTGPASLHSSKPAYAERGISRFMPHA